MAKRLTDSKKWDDDWFLGLPSHYKLLWLYMLDKCDHAGFFKPTLKLANFCIDFDFKKEDIFKWFGNRIEVVGDKWFLTKYIKFQYGYLTSINNMYKPVIKLLEENGKGLISPFVAPYKGVRREKGIGKGNKKGKGNIVSDFEQLWSAYPSKVGKKEAERHFNASVKTDKDMQDIKKALQNYLRSERVHKGYVQNGSTWFNNWRDWIDYTEDICSKCKGKGKYTSTTGYEVICDCPKGLAVKK